MPAPNCLGTKSIRENLPFSSRVSFVYFMVMCKKQVSLKIQSNVADAVSLILNS